MIDDLQQKWPELDFSDSIWEGYKKSITYICKVHGKQTTTPHELSKAKRKSGCGKCGILRATIGNGNPMTKSPEEHYDDVYKVHGDKYDYSNTDFTIKSLEYLTVICPKHGEFKVSLNNHKSGRGCPNCAKEENRLKTLGWKYSKWREAGEISKDFTGYKLYEIKCYKNKEVFYKVGKTYVNIKKRFGKSKFPYNYEIINSIIGDAYYISKLEEYYKRKLKEYKYIPLLSFGGMHKCFSKPINIEHQDLSTNNKS